MASEVPSVKTPASSLVQGSHTTQVLVPRSGNALPPSGNATAALPVTQSVNTGSAAAKVTPTQAKATLTQVTPAQATPTQVNPTQATPTQVKASPTQTRTPAQQAQKTSTQTQVASLNKALNDSGLPAKFRASPDDKDVQEVNPVSGEVVAVYPADEFAALAKSVGIPGVLLNEIA